MKKLTVGLIVSGIFFTGILAGCQQTTKEKPTQEITQQHAENKETIVTTKYGKVEGSTQDGVRLWQGIPYAADPSGSNRWKEPQDPQSWEGIKKATAPGNVAIQASADGIIGSEDALNLDIYRTDTNKDKLPVLVYVHGGNNQTGNAQELSGASFVKTHDAIMVSVNYRLGVLGFNPLPALKHGTELENSGNYSLLDLNKSLEWIQQNIAAFGGDPENVTISGFSAGGRDVMAMLMSPIFEGKFQKAISFSGGMTIADEAESQEIFAEALAPLVVEDQLATSNEEAKSWLLQDDTKVKDYLYGLDSKRLAPLMGNAGIRMRVFPHLYNDGVVLPKEGFQGEIKNDVPLLMITGDREFSLFGRFDSYFAEYIADGRIDTDPNIKAQYDFINKYGGELYSLFNVQESAETLGTKYQKPIYAMELLFGQNAAVVGEEMAKIGSFHGVFVPLLDQDNHNYDALVKDGYNSVGAKTLSDDFQQTLFSFIQTGNPDFKGIKWQPWNQSDGDILYLDADKENVIATVEKKSYTYEDVLREMEQDTSISSEEKQVLIKQVLNGRWFSERLDQLNE